VHDGLPRLEPPLLPALLVGVAGQVYAVPQADVAGVARIPQDDLAAIYAGQRRDFSAPDGPYRVAHLGRLLDPTAAADLDQRRWLPLLLTRAGAPRLALQVDQVIGSTRITVTPLGPLLAALRWLAGGTILADGRVALILDAQALVQAASGHDEGRGADGTAAAAPLNQEEPGPLAPAPAT
jgi:chemosensory pili system protein ChpA (sensor histidine kinase/response regulator)